MKRDQFGNKWQRLLVSYRAAMDIVSSDDLNCHNHEYFHAVPVSLLAAVSFLAACVGRRFPFVLHMAHASLPFCASRQRGRRDSYVPRWQPLWKGKLV